MIISLYHPSRNAAWYIFSFVLFCFFPSQFVQFLTWSNLQNTKHCSSFSIENWKHSLNCNIKFVQHNLLYLSHTARPLWFPKSILNVHTRLCGLISACYVTETVSSPGDGTLSLQSCLQRLGGGVTFPVHWWLIHHKFMTEKKAQRSAGTGSWCQHALNVMCWNSHVACHVTMFFFSSIKNCIDGIVQTGEIPKDLMLFFVFWWRHCSLCSNYDFTQYHCATLLCRLVSHTFFYYRPRLAECFQLLWYQVVPIEFFPPLLCVGISKGKQHMLSFMSCVQMDHYTHITSALFMCRWRN